ncbi:MAG: aminotransferase class I/II-fold pyridoxal phosphate-dependent enzyme [Phycisphaerae bacterium]|nr:aminotransferase class I/II-fold pyridoxal phosphate-dependent enzyme [Phycisphaerae bacterium]
MTEFEAMISQKCRKVDASGIRKVFDLAAKMKDPINFSIGQPHFDVPDAIKAEAIAAIQSGFNSYTPTQGYGPLREQIAGLLTDELGWPTPSVLVTSGVSGGLLLAFLALLNPGDEVLIADPYFVMYKHLVNLVGATPVTVDTYPDFRLDPDKFAAKITPRTKLLLINSPANPTGKLASPDELKAMLALADKHGLLVISDEVYNEFCYDGRYVSAARMGPPNGVLLLRGFSKTYGMTGWRMGYAAGPQAVIEQMTKLQQYTFVCAPSMAQKACMVALRTDMSSYVAEYRRKRDIIYDGLKGAFDVTRQGGAFYTFPKAPGSAGATAFCERAIANNVLIIPGGVFSARDTHFRLSFAAPDDRLKMGAEILCRLARQAG